ncbi:hypothetical protein [Janthinobacterium sp.]|uniref:hypothetical protein n=1 Tax=Janthinobacterium sp. TaxID=1871054 RepID=UPI0026128D27|nr:hypothetical protein [Janthinobacterium sp.]
MPVRNTPLALSTLVIMSCLAAGTHASAAEATSEWEKNNNWTVEITNSPKLMVPIFVTLRLVGARWEIDGVFDRPPSIPRSQQIELLVATKDLQHWGNFYTNVVANCDSFEVKEADFHSVCTSALSEKQSTSSAALGLFFGGGAKRPVSYNAERVRAAVQSISVEQALRVLTAFEKSQGGYRTSVGGN